MLAAVLLLPAIAYPASPSARGSEPDADEARQRIVTLIDDMPGAECLAAPATGQTLYVCDGNRREIAALDPFAPAKRWKAVDARTLAASGSNGLAQPRAIACIDSNTLAVVCEQEGEWSVRSFRLAAPGSTTESARLVQNLSLGRGPGRPADPAGSGRAIADILVSPSRDWLAVVGLPGPLPPIMRTRISGSNLGPFSENRCPRPDPSGQLLAATVSPFDDWLMFTAAVPSAMLSIHAESGAQRMLHLETGLVEIRDAATSRGSGLLWAVAARAEATAGPRDVGLWRIDAALVRGRQIARPLLIAPIDSPSSLVCLSDRAIAVTAGGANRRVLLVTTAPPDRE
jgi:hypothetical protein